MAGNSAATNHTDLASGIAYLTSFIPKYAGNMAFCLLMEEDGKLITYDRTGQPCYGEMRPYGTTDKGLTGPRAKDPRPYDLVTPFPKGTPVACALAFRTVLSEVHTPALKDFLSVILNPETSPWRHVLQNIEVVENAKGTPVGIVFKDANIDSTVLIDLWMTLRYRVNQNHMVSWARLRELAPDVNPNILVLSLSALSPSVTLTGAKPTVAWTQTWDSDYFLHQKLDTKRFLSGDPVLEGMLKDRAAYNRPEIHFVFGKTEMSIYQQFAGARAKVYTDKTIRSEFLDKFADIVSTGNASTCAC